MISSWMYKGFRCEIQSFRLDDEIEKNGYVNDSLIGPCKDRKDLENWVDKHLAK